MSLAFILTPVAIALELVIGGLGIYAGYTLKKTCGYPFAVTFLIFALFDYFGSRGVSTEILSVLNIIAVLASLVGMYLLVRENLTKTS
ncbi:hypothetical protein [uncultured Methanoregula sp.]|uniref:hypothetical protein n=1 Tax=uncultured Methanoregula sp. TaxID=1005933 RepID=UPI002AAC45BC|nr:hypothetical protein [uncultured Methanoregula sp.]